MQKNSKDEQNGIINLGTVTSNGKTGQQWIKGLGAAVHGTWARDVLNSEEFNPTDGVTSQVVVIKGTLWNDSDRLIKNIYTKAEKIQFEKPNAEIAGLIMKKFSEKIKVLGLNRIIVMSNPIRDCSERVASLLCIEISNNGLLLTADFAQRGDGWRRDDGFAFEIREE